MRKEITSSLLIIFISLSLFFMFPTNGRLEALKNGNKLREYVLDYIRANYLPTERIPFILDVIRFGCVSGMVSELVYYADTHAFFDRFYDEIEELRQEWEDNTGEPLKIKGDLKNEMAWLGFEEAVCQIARELDLW